MNLAPLIADRPSSTLKVKAGQNAYARQGAIIGMSKLLTWATPRSGDSSASIPKIAQLLVQITAVLKNFSSSKKHLKQVHFR
jgi:hypothetical protein